MGDSPSRRHFLFGCLLSGLGFYFQDTREGFQGNAPGSPPKNTIFYFEALAVTSVVLAATHLPSVPHHLLIYCDNTNTVDIFHSFRSLPVYNDLLKYTVSLLLKFHISLHIVHIPGEDNKVADALSRFDNERALNACPGLTISSFEPPRVTLGQAK